MKVYLEYVKAVGPLLSVFICFLYGCQSAAAIGANIWLSQWTNDAANNQTQENVNMRVGVYAALGLAQGKTGNYTQNYNNSCIVLLNEEYANMSRY